MLVAREQSTVIVPIVAVVAVVVVVVAAIVVGGLSTPMTRVRPVRRDTIYSQGRPRRTHRPHVGFSLSHFTLDLEQEMQLSRSFRVPCAPPAPVEREGTCCWDTAVDSMNVE